MNSPAGGTVTLRSGARMPRLGLGVFRAGSGAGTRDAVRAALDAGYRHIDTAAIYRNEVEVGEAIRAFCGDTGARRKDVFVTTKLWNDDHGYDEALAAYDRSERALGIGPLDLYLIHWPVPEKRLDSWRALSRLRAEGRCRAVGVSNFTASHLEELAGDAETMPDVNQVEIHPFLAQRELVAACRERRIQTVAYSPLAKARRPLRTRPVRPRRADRVGSDNRAVKAQRTRDMNAESTKVAFLGLGAMGRRMARRLSDAGYALTVWSRSGSTRSDLPGATHAPTIAAAVAGAGVVMAMVRDDAASREVWLGPEGARAHLREGAIAVEHSTLGPAWVTEVSAALHSAGAHFVEAPVVGSRPQAESGNLVFLAGGSGETLARVRPHLAAMGSAVHHLGDAPAGAHTKLIVNTLFAVQVAALAELLGLGAKAGLDVGALLETLSGLPVLSAAAKGAGAGMVAGAFDPMFPVELVTKDLRYALTSAESAGARLPIGESAHRVFEAGLASGLGGENLTAVTKLYR